MANISELYGAASLGETDTIYKVIQQNPRILEVVDAVPFVNTPLHTAAYAGHLEFSIEIMRLKPSFGSKLNEQGFSPIHLALQNNQHNLVRRLVEINKDLVRVKGREGVTPLHFLCQSGDDNENITLLIDLLEACPDSIEDVNVRNETALHIALINGNLRAFRIIVGWLRSIVREDAFSLERSILNWKDSDGNTILHIATRNANQQAVDLLIKRLNINAKNLKNETALDLAEAHALPTITETLLKAKAKRGASVDDDSNREDKLKLKSPLSLFFILTDRNRMQISEQQRNAVMVVATLVVTALYQTVLSPPGGLTQGGSDNGPNSNNLVNATSSLNSTAVGKSVLSSFDFYTITSLNCVTLWLGIGMISGLMPTTKLSIFVSIPLALFLVSYLVSASVISPSQTLMA
ncbi:ankyrin repeat-containing protein BDA1-like [Arachis stenosperma]|uniref:ankyrin repeat-containing protein BDA1-like n=1 Tax=Arachis stenosperma TaxID=217475 RepID=UPI0025ACA256|nr:ankyrin repeat-containing protein BDA1-like [Arachis stenosperma]